MNRRESIQWILETVDGSHFAVRWLFQGQISGSSRWDQEAQSGAWNILSVWSRLSHFSGPHRAGEFSFDSYKWETEARLHFTADIQSFQLSWSICLHLIFYVAEEKAAGKCKPRRHDCLNLKMSGTKWRTTVETWKTMLTLCWNGILTNTVMSIRAAGLEAPLASSPEKLGPQRFPLLPGGNGANQLVQSCTSLFFREQLGH